MFQCFKMFQIQCNIFKNDTYLDVSTNIAVWFKHCLNQKPIPTCLNVSDVSNIYSFCETCFEKLFVRVWKMVYPSNFLITINWVIFFWCSAIFII